MPPGCGVAVATSMAVSKTTPDELMSAIDSGSPSTHGYGMLTVARPKRGTNGSGSTVKFQMASSTATWAIVTGSGPPLTIST